MAKIYDITDFSAPELDVYARLTENQLVNRADPANALFIAESPLGIGRALDAGCEPVSFLMERQHTQGKGREILARCCQDIPVYTADESVLTQLTGFHLTRGMLCAMRRPKLQSVEDVCRDARRLVVLENVGNLVCPAEFDTGAVKNAMILSVPEGHDKPLKYPLIFTVCDALIINKIDVLPYFDFDMEKVVEYAHMRNPKLKIFPLSAKTGEGVDAWCDWLREQVRAWNG